MSSSRKPDPTHANADPHARKVGGNPRKRKSRPDHTRSKNPCDHHKRGDLCGYCGFGMYGFDTSDFDGYCD